MGLIRAEQKDCDSDPGRVSEAVLAFRRSYISCDLLQRARSYGRSCGTVGPFGHAREMLSERRRRRRGPAWRSLESGQARE